MGGPEHNRLTPSPRISGPPIPNDAYVEMGKKYMELLPCALMPAVMAFREGVIDEGEMRRCIDLWRFGEDFRVSDMAKEWDQKWRQHEDPPWRRRPKEGPALLVRVGS